MFDPSESGAESSGSYLGKLTQSPLLTAGEEVVLARAARLGDETARKKLVESNMRLVINVARSYVNSAIPLEDLIQEGAIGLMRAVERFDPDRGFRFSTYATHWIRQAIRRALDNKAKTIRLPAHVMQLVRKIEREKERIFAETGEEPSHEALAQKLGMNTARLDIIMRCADDLLSLDLRVAGGAGSTLGGMIADPDAVEPDLELLRGEFSVCLESAIEQLSEREQSVIRSRLASEGRSQDFIESFAKRNNMTRERVRQIEIIALHKLRAFARERQLIEYL